LWVGSTVGKFGGGLGFSDIGTISVRYKHYSIQRS
jgi:hypothetical protein